MYNSGFLTLIRQSWRSIWRNWRRTVITISAISMGIGLAIFFVALGQGVYTQMVTSVVRSLGGHFTVEHKLYRDAPAVDLAIDNADKIRAEISQLPHIATGKALILGQAVYRSAHGTTGGLVMGVEPESEKELSDLADKIIKGEYLEGSDRNKVVIGKGIADRLKLKVGRKIIISTNNAEGELSESRFRVKGIYETKSPELDSFVIQMTLKDARKLFLLKPHQVTQLGFLVNELKDRDSALAAASKIAKEHTEGNSAALPWEAVQKELAEYIKLDRGGNWIMQSILIFLSLFTIWNTILMSVLERSREFAVMLALGTKSFRIRTQVAIESTFIGILGAGLGIVMGGGLAFYFSRVGINFLDLMGGKEANVAGFSISGIVYPKVEMDMLLWFGGLVFFSTILMSFFASNNVRKISVTDVLR